MYVCKETLLMFSGAGEECSTILYIYYLYEKKNMTKRKLKNLVTFSSLKEKQLAVGTIKHLDAEMKNKSFIICLGPCIKVLLKYLFQMIRAKICLL